MNRETGPPASFVGFFLGMTIKLPLLRYAALPRLPMQNWPAGGESAGQLVETQRGLIGIWANSVRARRAALRVGSPSGRKPAKNLDASASSQAVQVKRFVRFSGGYTEKQIQTRAGLGRCPPAFPDLIRLTGQ